ncbi:MAG: hypothetical protein R6V56_05235 [Lentisphaeria bacterium]
MSFFGLIVDGCRGCVVIGRQGLFLELMFLQDGSQGEPAAATAQREDPLERGTL